MVALDRRSEAARAFPRPSASDSAKFEKSTVSQSQAETMPTKKTEPPAGTKVSYRNMSVVRIPPISTENMTGFLHSRLKSRFLMALTDASRNSAASKAVTGVTLFRATSEPPCKSEVFCDGPHREQWEEGERPDNQNHCNQPEHE